MTVLAWFEEDSLIGKDHKIGNPVDSLLCPVGEKFLEDSSERASPPLDATLFPDKAVDPMLTFLFIFGGSFLLCVLLIPPVRGLSFQWGLVDHPDACRKLHARVIPLVGGLAVLMSTCVVIGLLCVLQNPFRDDLLSHSHTLFGLLLSSWLLCGLGVVDDLKCLRGRHKLLGQILVVCIVIGFGVRIDCLELFGLRIELGLLAVPFTTLWLLGAINSLNLIDGMDGMLGAVGFIISLAMCGMALLGGHIAWACVAAALAGALLGFLRYNFPPATVFMGDAGSMVTGLVIGVLGIQSSLKAPATVALIVPVGILTIPFLDTLAALLRRHLTGRSIYTTDRGHLHHCLLGHGYSACSALALVSLFCLITSFGGLTSLALKNELIAICTVLTVSAVLITTRLFGYAEFLLVKKRLSRFMLSFMQTRAEGRSHQIEVHLHGNRDWKALMDAVTSLAFELNLQTVRFDVSVPALHEEYHSQWDRFEEEVEEVLWRIEIPVTIEERFVGRVLVSGYLDKEPVWVKVARLHRLIEEFQQKEKATHGDRTVVSIHSKRTEVFVDNVALDLTDGRKSGILP